MTISVVAFMEAFSVAKAIEIKQKNHKVVANQELIGLGAANLVGSLFQSYPVTGGFSRSAVNHLAGANTPLSSIVSASLVALSLIFLTLLFYYLPEAILASIILVAISSLVDFRYAKKLWTENKSEFFLLMTTFLVTLNFSIVYGIIIGVILSILVLLYRVAYPHIAIMGRLKGQTEFRNVKRFPDVEVWRDKIILRVDAPISFINIQYIKDFIEQELGRHPDIKEILLDASAISHIDASACEVLIDFLSSLKEKGINLLVAEVIGPVRDTLYKTGLLQKIGKANIFLTVHDALEADLNANEYFNREKALQHN